MNELETRRPQKLIWYLVPTVTLCLQQHDVIVTNLPAVKSRTLTGLDKVDKWTEQAIWDAILKDMQVVVSTHAVLEDAVRHGFVRMSQLGLLIFDEAHHCMRRHPANRIMQDFYHPTLATLGPEAVPRILGLTASPVVRTSSKELSIIEANLNAICRTPRAHRPELLSHTHRPHLQQIWYTPINIDDPTVGTKTLRALVHAWETIDLEDDPYVKKLRRSAFDGKALQKTLLTRKTYCNGQLKKFIERSCHIYQELGGWAVDYFIHASVGQLRAQLDNSSMMLGWDPEEKAYLVDFFSTVPSIQCQPPRRHEDFFPSPKLEALISFLTAAEDPHFSGLVFAKQRATVSVLTTLLSVHPLTKERFRSAAFVGWSGGGENRKDFIGELLSMQMQRDTLSEFRSGQKNLIVATDVLEEGIDISACSMVICYDKPSNLKSFVQRRGRARHKESTFAIMFSTEDELCDLKKWQVLEQAMIEAYQDDERKRCEALESNAEAVDERFEVDSTGAVLTADTAVAHLYHFCSTLPKQPYADNRPEISFESDGTGRQKGIIKLPNCVHPDVRRTQGTKWWNTERAATKEAAFQAYKRLYEFGLVNDNLLPLTRKPELRLTEFGDLPSMIEAADQYDPWTDWAYSWSSPDIHQSRILVQLNGSLDYQLSMTLTGPTVLPPLDTMTLFWDSENIFTLTFDVARKVPLVPENAIRQMRDITALYLQAPSSRQLRAERDYVVLFGPDLPHSELGAWLLKNNGHDTALEVYSRETSPPIMGIVRDRTRYNEPLLFKKWVVTDDGDISMLEMECDSLPRRRNLLHRQTLAPAQYVIDEGISGPAAKVRIVPATACTIDRLPFSDTIFGLFISVILDRLEATLIATRLCETILQDVQFSSTNHVITAISAPSAQGLTNYQRYEFFGDAVLKLTVACQLFVQHPTWHEGYLSERRDEIVQNQRLARAALELGLDSFIITKMFTPRKWSAPLISEKAIEMPAKRAMSTKVLADVVESLIGAAYVDGGYEKAHTCIRRLLPEIEIAPMTAPSTPATSSHVMNETLKEHIGYTFVNESLLVEALTHPSCQSDPSTQSYQRLEFLGDAVLDMVVVHAMAHHPAEYPQGEMTLIKHALTNANLLAFFCMEFVVAQDQADVDATPDGKFTIQSGQRLIELWRFMRSEALDMNNARANVLRRHRLLRDEVIHALHHGAHYPWQALSQLNADKFFSDIVESILGAIFVDSGGNLDVSTMFVERIGLLSYFRRILSDGVNVTHPRNTAQRLSKGDAQFTVKRIVDGSGSASYTCLVKMKDSDLVVVEGCLSSEEAEVKAANATIGILKANAPNLA
ncbi:ATP-dependent helicase dcl2 [Aspergillus ambiguus]|uniref:ATP-dependent helicase dcl2 n=1 Tax=Aspergillus ambiguus TaxID=176160 RepID=UPI003CCCE298